MTPIKNTHESFGLMSKALHWLMAVLITGLFSVGLYMVELEYYDSLYHTLPWWHKSFGLLVLFLLVFRLIWKVINKEPDALESHQWWEVLLANLIQKLFYFLILSIGVTGYFIATAKGKGIEFFNWFEVPAVVSNIKEGQADLVGDAHKILAITLAVFVVLHALAALKHHFIDKDKTLKRML